MFSVKRLAFIVISLLSYHWWFL